MATIFGTAAAGLELSVGEAGAGGGGAEAVRETTGDPVTETGEDPVRYIVEDFATENAQHLDRAQ